MSKKILIGIPVYQDIHYRTAMWLFNIARQIDCHLMMMQAHDISWNRNLIAHTMLEQGYDELIFLDSDIAPPPNYMELVNSDLDVVSWVANVILDRNAEKVAFAWFEKDLNFAKVLKSKTPTEVSRIGFWFCKIKRKVIEAVINRFWCLCNFEYEADGIKRIWEDYSFSKRAMQCGYKIHLMGSVYASHYKTMDLKKIVINSALNNEPWKKIK
jgi:hypothetical protein